MKARVKVPFFLTSQNFLKMKKKEESLLVVLYKGEVVLEVKLSQTQAQESCVPTQMVEDSTECIIRYVGRLHPSYVSPSWQAGYEQLWRQILQLPSVAAQVHKPGKQKGTTFNRNLVANILHLLSMQEVLTTDNATHLATVLEGDKRHSVRAQLSNRPSNKATEKEVQKLINDSDCK